MTEPTISILPDKTALVQYALGRSVDIIQQAIADHGYCTLALAGGSTPKPLYEGLAQQDLPWDKLYIFWGDERYVPVDHPDSNAGMAKQAWLDQVPIPADHIHITPTAEGDPAQSAQGYEDMLKAAFAPLQPLSGAGFPRFDLIWLGMGDDGHTASLFPHTAALEEAERWITVGDKDGEPRITFTASLINHSRRVMVVAAGASKQPALAQVFSATAADADYPIRLVRPTGTLEWLLDAEAVGNLALPDAQRITP
ncbi:6-phosphogluconolactonase [Leptolyngbya sp. BL0902]|uniref:6-phosphogluconolactonase n=1 Tax=Leptolyngbya sp. BL0902 TaxID=1115757 RepID=UPI0018E85F6D|nr:6-phosphogluconolactonase [Leptolyngbya sp. BL0902]QQE65280.1 6-phosphogluconolactonase [Leptolyngbya sp. BL0902]